MRQVLDQKIIVRSLIYKLSERSAYQGITFIVNIVLARILDPSDYGVLTILTVFINLSQVFVQSGLNTALIQNKDTSDEDYSTVFIISFVLAAILYFLLFILAPYIAEFYDMPTLTKALRIIAIMLFPGSLNSVQNAKIAREMQYKKLLFCTFSGVLVSGFVGITLAYLGYGVMALVFQQIANSITLCIALRFATRWKPKIYFSIERAKVLFSFGWKLLCSSFIDTLYNDIQNLVIGKRFSSEALGYYNRGNQFPYIIITNINSSIQSIMLTTLSMNQDNKVRVKSMLRRSIVTSSFLIFPLMMCLGLIAKPLVKILLTEKWIECVPYLQLMCFAYAFWPIHTANLQAINSQGRSDIFLKLEIIKKVIGIVAVCIAIIFFKSVYSIVIGSALLSPIAAVINSVPNQKLLNYKINEQIMDIFPSLVITCITGVCIWAVSIVDMNEYILVFTQVFVGVFVYISLAKLLKLECFKYLEDFVRAYYKKSDS